MSTFTVVAISIVVAYAVVAAVAWLGMKMKRPSQPAAAAPPSIADKAKPIANNPAQAAFDNVGEQILRARHTVRASTFPLRPQAEELLADAERCYGFAVAAGRVDQTVSAFVLLQRARGAAAQAASLAPAPVTANKRPGVS